MKGWLDKQISVTKQRRAIIFDWLVELHTGYSLQPETLFLAFNLFDRFLYFCNVEKRQIQLLALTCMFIACKYEEVHVPLLSDLLYLTKSQYSRSDVFKLEKVILRSLDFELLIVNPYTLLLRFHDMTTSSSNRKLLKMSQFILELCAIDYDMLEFCTSKIVLCCMILARKVLKEQDDLGKLIYGNLKIKKEFLAETMKKTQEAVMQYLATKLDGLKRKFMKNENEKVCQILMDFYKKI